MSVPSLTEQEASDLALFALNEAFRRRGEDPTGLDRTHLVKAVYLLADEFDLPITRCWFKFGRFVLGDFVTTDRFHRIRASGPGPLSVRIGTDLRPLAHRMAVRAETLVPFFREPMDEYLPDHYRVDAPEEYRQVYATNFEWVSFCRRLLGGDDSTGHRTRYASIAAPLVTGYQRVIAPFIRDDEARSLLLEYSTFLEELMIRYDGLMADPRFDVRDWRTFFSRALAGHVEWMWTLCGAQIAVETLRGPRADAEREGMLRTASLGARYREETYEPIRGEAAERGYLPTEEDMAELLVGARGATATRAEALEELSYLMRKGD